MGWLIGRLSVYKMTWADIVDNFISYNGKTKMDKFLRFQIQSYLIKSYLLSFA